METDTDQCTIQYRGYRNGDETAIIDLFNFVFNRSFTTDDWHWAYKENPVARNDIILAFCNTRLVGQAASVPLTYLCRGTPVKATRTQNVMVHPGFQGRGIFTLALKELTSNYYREKLDLVVTFPNNNSLPTFIKKLDYTHVADIFTYQLKSENLDRNPCGDLTFTIGEPSGFNEADHAYILKCLGRYEFANYRTLPYLRWRYSVRSNKNYRILRAFRGGEIAALVVFKYYRDASGVDLVEFFADPLICPVGALLNRIEEYYAGENMPVSSYSIWLFPHYHHFGAFTDAGFEKTSFSTHVVTKSFSPVTAEGCGDCTSFYLSMGDSDVY